MKTLKKYAPLFIVFLVLKSCSKETDNPIVDFYENDIKVYVSGYEDVNGKNAATVWLNGVPTPLTDGTATALANTLFVTGTDVYAAGYQKNNTTNRKVAKIWKNGQEEVLSDGVYDSQITAIHVTEGGDVYAIGYESRDHFIAKIWKNGVVTNLTDGTNEAYVYDITVLDNDVYVVGYEKSNNIRVAKLWKNGVAESLTDGTNGSHATTIFIDGNDIFIGINEYLNSSFQTKIIKNGTLTSVIDTFYISSLYVEGEDIYAGGSTINETAAIWKNGETTILDNGGYVFDLQVVDSNIYSVGSDYDGATGNMIAKIWKNEQVISMANETKSSQAYSIVIQKNN